MELKQAKEMVAQTHSALEKKYGKQDAYRQLCELAEEVGEVAEAIKAEEGEASKQHAKGKIGAELSDVLYSVCTLSNYYKTDLDGDFEKVIARIRNRYLE